MRAHFIRYRSAYLLAALLSVGLLVRLYAFSDAEAVSYQSDYNRDYLIADHIVRLHEFPLTGPEGQFGPYVESPLYFYILSFFLLIKNDILFLGLVNVVMQTGVILLAFLIAKELFGRRTALVSAALVALLDCVVAQSEYVWQPNVMQVFLLLTTLFLIRGYTRHRIYLYLSAAFFVFALAMHFSALALLPLLLLIVAYQERERFGSFLLWCGTLLATAALVFSPTIWYGVHSGSLTILKVYMSHAVESGTEGLAVGSLHRFVLFVQQILGYASLPMAVIAAAFFFFAAGIYFRFRGQRKLPYAILSLCAILLVAVASGGVHVAPYILFPLRYYTPVLVIFLILCAELMVSFCNRTSFPKAFLLILMLGVLMTGASRTAIYAHYMFHRSVQGDFSWVRPVYAPIPFFVPTADFLLKVGKDTIPLFYTVSFKDGEYDPYSSELLWVPLERLTRGSFIRVDDSQYRGYRMLGKNMLLLCTGAKKESCLDMYRNFTQQDVRPSYASEGDVMLYWFASEWSPTEDQ